jgi:hypothetical protein
MYKGNNLGFEALSIDPMTYVSDLASARSAQLRALL